MIMQIRHHAISLLLCTALLCAVVPYYAAAQEKKLDRIVATVENEAITERQLEKNLSRTRRMLERQNRKMPDERTLVGQVLQQMIILQLQLQEAKRLGISIDDITLDHAVEDMARRNNLNLSELKQQVENSGDDFQDLREQIRNDLTIRQLIQTEVINRIEVSDQEIDGVLMPNEAARAGAEYHFAHLRVPPQESADVAAAMKNSLTQVHRQMRGDTFFSFRDLRQHFAKLWRTATKENKVKKSIRYQVKDLGWRRTEKLPAPVRRRIDSIHDSHLSPIIANDDGLHLFVLLASRSDSPTMMQQQYRVRHILMQTTPIEDDETIRRKLLKIKRQLKNGADFEALACQHSEDPLSSMRGGELDWASPESYAPAFAEAIKRARGKGDIVGPFKSSFGWHLLEVIDTRERDVGDDTIRGQAIAQIRQRKSGEETRLWLLNLRENRSIEVRL